MAWLQFRQYSHRLQKQEERYEGRPRLLAPKLSQLTVEEKAHGLALTKRRELKAEILSSKRRNLVTPGSQVPPEES